MKNILLITGYTNTEVVFEKLTKSLKLLGYEVDIFNHPDEPADTLNEYVEKCKKYLPDKKYEAVLGYSFGASLLVGLSKYIKSKKFILVNPYIENDTISDTTKKLITLLGIVYNDILRKNDKLLKWLFIAFYALTFNFKHVKELIEYPERLFYQIPKIVLNSDIDIPNDITRKKYEVVASIKDQIIDIKNIAFNKKLDIPLFGDHTLPDTTTLLILILR